MNHRQKLVELRDSVRKGYVRPGVYDIAPKIADDIDAILADWPEDTKVMPRAAENERLYVVFDGMPGPEGPRFIEVENQHGESVRAGEWERDEGTGLCYLGPLFRRAYNLEDER